ncbi:hypothetical protein KUCAC02_024067 [Chaenocephalus aceratus]|uniref:Uncharacterized protein n=1 Tax=Chaenocephalus aceratus TaxID=36190 RepID=A0ACB9WI78_CHAAC|nr:hypothetical protein KUCAC02_024067 [Chaenocephalus aceratus]
MERRLGHYLFIFFSKWIWLFTLTSILGGTKGEIRCIPSCQLPLITEFPRDLSELDFTNFGEASAEELVGFTEGSPGAKPNAGGEEKHTVAELTASEESSSKVQPRSEGNKSSCPQKDALNDQPKLSHPKEFTGSASPAAAPSPCNGNVTENNTGDGKHNEENDGEHVDVTVNEENDVASWRRTRSARSAEAWSGFRAEDGEDVSFSDLEELELTSSTFALAGDTAHNQAMVHWSGQNSSVSSLCAPYLRTDLF